MNQVKEAVGKIVPQIQEMVAKSFSSNQLPSGSLGVDIGSHSVKVVRLEAAKDNIKILGFGIERVVEKNFRDALSKALVKTKVVAGESVVVAVTGQGVVSRYVDMPLMSRSELESSMKFEIEKYVPFNLSEVSAAYDVVYELKDKAKMSVLIAAAKNELLQKKCNLMREMNVNVRVVDLDCLALANFSTEFVMSKEKKYCVCVVQIGKTVCHINILVDGLPHLSRDIFIGGDDLTKKMSETLNLDYAEAEKLKNDPLERLQEFMGVWETPLNNLAEEIRISLDYFEARTNRAVDKIFITGGSSRLSGIDNFLNHILSVEVKPLSFVDRLNFDAAVNREDFKLNSDLMSVSIGLALR
jgi:type IV pilus assembly protein PilM